MVSKKQTGPENRNADAGEETRSQFSGWGGYSPKQAEIIKAAESQVSAMRQNKREPDKNKPLTETDLPGNAI